MNCEICEVINKLDLSKSTHALWLCVAKEASPQAKACDQGRAGGRRLTRLRAMPAQGLNANLHPRRQDSTLQIRENQTFQLP
jgi:hypothetical protein